MRLYAHATAALISASACAHEPGPGKVRFENRPIVWRVDDRVPFAGKPEERKFNRRLLLLEGAITEPIDRTLSVPTKIYAQNINALDEVPDSSWFENRLLHGLTPEQVRVGPMEDSAVNLLPWKVLSTKVGGKSLGFLIEDSLGNEHLLKFDDPGFPELKSAAGTVAQRLFWALGYHVPVDDVATFESSDLILAEDAVEKVSTNERPLTKERFAELLTLVEREGDKFRGLVSRLLPGEPLGGYAMEGVNADDPNDRVAHENRRDVRAHFTFFAWLEHTDWKQDNRLDMWVPESKGSARGHIEHYILDFDKALGVMSLVSPREPDGFVYAFDPGYTFLSLASFGLWTRPWEKIQLRHEGARRGVGRFESVVFEPELWRPRLPEPGFFARDRFDDFWAAKQLMRLSEDHIRAAVQAGQYSDPLAEYYLYETLLARREKLAKHAFERVTPLDRFEVSVRNGRFTVCFDDLWIKHGFGPDARTNYKFRAWDFEGKQLDASSAASSIESPTACTGELTIGAREADYTILTIDVMRESTLLEPVEVHLARAPSGELRVIGVVRRPS